MITKSSSAKSVGIWTAWHQRSSWAQPRARVQSSGCHAVFRFSSAKTTFRRQTPWFLSILVVFAVSLRVRHALSRDRLFSRRFS